MIANFTEEDWCRYSIERQPILSHQTSLVVGWNYFIVDFTNNYLFCVCVCFFVFFSHFYIRFGLFTNCYARQVIQTVYIADFKVLL